MFVISTTPRTTTERWKTRSRMAAARSWSRRCASPRAVIISRISVRECKRRDISMRLNLAAGLLDRARGSPDKTAFVFRDSTVSYAPLRPQMLSVAAGLVDAGVRPGHRVALSLPNGPGYVAAWLAVQWIGGVVLQRPAIDRRRQVELVR